MPAFPVRIRTKINLQKGPLRFDKLFIIVIMKMSFLRGGAAKGLAVPPHFAKIQTFLWDSFLEKTHYFGTLKALTNCPTGKPLWL